LRDRPLIPKTPSRTRQLPNDSEARSFLRLVFPPLRRLHF